MNSTIVNAKKKTKNRGHHLTYRKASLSDAKAIHALVNSFAAKNRMLPRSLNDIYELIRDFFICLIKDRVVAVCSLHIVWEDLAEIRSVAVLKKYQRKDGSQERVELNFHPFYIIIIYIFTNIQHQ